MTFITERMQELAGLKKLDEATNQKVITAAKKLAKDYLQEVQEFADERLDDVIQELSDKFQDLEPEEVMDLEKYFQLNISLKNR